MPGNHTKFTVGNIFNEKKRFNIKPHLSPLSLGSRRGLSIPATSAEDLKGIGKG